MACIFWAVILVKVVIYNKIEIHNFCVMYISILRDICKGKYIRPLVFRFVSVLCTVYCLLADMFFSLTAIIQLAFVTCAINKPTNRSLSLTVSSNHIVGSDLLTRTVLSLPLRPIPSSSFAVTCDMGLTVTLSYVYFLSSVMKLRSRYFGDLYSHHLAPSSSDIFGD